MVLLCAVLAAAGCGPEGAANDSEVTVSGGGSQPNTDESTTPDTSGTTVSHITLERGQVMPASSQGTGEEKLELVGEITFWTNPSFGTDHMVGEIRNTGSRVVSFVEIEVDFLDTFGNVIGNEWTYVEGRTWTLSEWDFETDACVQPGDTVPFRIYLGQVDQEIDDVQYTISWESYDLERPDAYLSVTAIAPNLDSSASWVDFDGQVKNTGSQALDWAWMWIAIREQGGDIFEVHSSMVDDEDLEVDETSTFEFVYVAHLSRAQSYYFGTNWDDDPPEAAAAARSLMYSGKSGTDLYNTVDTNQALLRSTSLGAEERWEARNGNVRALHERLYEIERRSFENRDKEPGRPATTVRRMVSR
ncbi:MAG: FxLYD domain-containing protein [Desulfatibacillaceae bacterium]